MCCRLSNSHHCLTFLSVLGLLQVIVSLPIIILSFLIFFQTTLGYLLSPFWCGFIILLAGFVALFIRPTRLASVICLHVILNATTIIVCIVAGIISGLYGTAVHLPNFNSLIDSTVTGSGSNANSTNTIRCIFSEDSELYSDNFRIVMNSLDTIIPSCDDLSDYWTYLIAIMSLCFIGTLVSLVALIVNCITPCVEDSYTKTYRPDSPKDY
ncbi:PREDICTED: uncharacterized protein LOC100634672 [Amphimedon queenslandica]|uniref:Uncharacterized protein n=1 Tax=Amphimedon queenslandica TaxID=400682 RepID=A0A1X7VVL8_AMPQE|nr:PREDICTED: uncharacterized protein LOC100634672 [Amphimedon queenslandica]|eukprot:XP_003382524.1 PREDICTED: uncharacterized protein LOC100634672 [Amphimedon queenslandica]